MSETEALLISMAIEGPVAFALVAGHTLSRLCATLVMDRLDYVRDEGKTKPLATSISRGSLAFAVLTALLAWAFRNRSVAVSVTTGGRSCRQARIIKDNLARHMDLVASAGLLVLVPFMGAVAALIRLTSPGPAIFTLASGSPLAGLMDSISPPEGLAIQSPWQAPEFSGSMSSFSRISGMELLAVRTLPFYPRRSEGASSPARASGWAVAVQRSTATASRAGPNPRPTAALTPKTLIAGSESGHMAIP